MNAARCLRAPHSLAVAAALAVALVVCALALAPGEALAKSYEMTRVRVDASVQPNGDVRVDEYRTFDFDGDFSSVYWEIPLANSQGIEVNGAGELIDGEGTAIDYVRDASAGSGKLSYQVVDDGEQVQVRLHFSKSDQEATFWVSYVVQGAAKAWADTGDVTWQAVGPGWEKPSKDVRVTLALPAPSGQQVELGQNVRAWADGPLDGTVSQEGDLLAFSCPQVDPGQYLSVMVAFPVEWLSGMAPSDQDHLAVMEQMGREVAESANAQRARARVVMVGATVLAVALAGGAVAFLLVKHRRFGREYQASFDDTYWRDVPSDDHPAVIGSLWRWGTTKDEDLTATLMRLTDEGAVRLERVTTTERGFLGRTKTQEDYRLVRDPEFDEGSLDAVDRAALDLVFETAAQGLRDSRDEASQEAADGTQSVLFSEFAELAKADARGYQERYDAWKDAVKNAAGRRDFYEAAGELWRGRAAGFAVALGVLAGVSLLFVGEVGWVVPAVLAVGAVVCGCIAPAMRRRSREANEVAAKTEALRRWLNDFTNLKEAVPTDVVLWDKLLVLAVVLGVSERVVEQLRMAAPQVLEDPLVAPVYLWYMPYGSMMSPVHAFDGAVEQAHALSGAQLAQTQDSSLGGGAGGFGGGGFGGSFGGGSFGGGGGGAN